MLRVTFGLSEDVSGVNFIVKIIAQKVLTQASIVIWLKGNSRKLQIHVMKELYDIAAPEFYHAFP